MKDIQVHIIIFLLIATLGVNQKMLGMELKKLNDGLTTLKKNLGELREKLDKLTKARAKGSGEADKGDGSIPAKTHEVSEAIKSFKPAYDTYLKEIKSKSNRLVLIYSINYNLFPSYKILRDFYGEKNAEELNKLLGLNNITQNVVDKLGTKFNELQAAEQQFKKIYEEYLQENDTHKKARILKDDLLPLYKTLSSFYGRPDDKPEKWKKIGLVIDEKVTKELEAKRWD